MHILAPALAYARAHRARFVEELKEFVRFPTVGAQPKHAADIRRCAAWLAAHLREIGLRSSVVKTSGHPLVAARWSGAPGKPTALVYGHYDVQPTDPLDEWTSPPFAPEVRGEELYGRGASDDKGQMWAHIKALEAWLKTAGRLPVNVVCVFEGEEETGSAGMIRFLREHRRALAADVAIVSDMPMRAPGVPAITYAMRGALSAEIEVRGPERDLHSGIFGGAVRNPLEALCEILARLHDARGRITIPGFYDRVRTWNAAERAYMARVGPTDAEILRDAGAEHAGGEPGFTLYERTTLRPSLSVNGVSGGYSGPGAKAVIPSSATAKLSLRLVPDQDPAQVARALRLQVARLAPPAVHTVVRVAFGARPALIERTHPLLRAAAAAVREGFGTAPVFLRSGGTIPVVSSLGETLGIPVVMLGLAHPDDRMHAPNEKFHLPNLFRGTETSIRMLARFGEMEAEKKLLPARESRAPSLL